MLVDQFHYGVFGGIGPTALACGTPLVSHLDHRKSSWCMDEPPRFEAWNVDSCVAALRSALDASTHDQEAELSAWIRSNYWYGEVVSGHAEVFMTVLGYGEDRERAASSEPAFIERPPEAEARAAVLSADHA